MEEPTLTISRPQIMPPNLETARMQLLRTARMAVDRQCSMRTVAGDIVQLSLEEMVHRVTAQSMVRLKHCEPEKPTDILVEEIGCGLFTGSSVPVEFVELPWLVARIQIGHGSKLVWYLVDRPTIKLEQLADVTSPFNAFDSVFTTLWSHFESHQDPVQVSALRRTIIGIFQGDAAAASHESPTRDVMARLESEWAKTASIAADESGILPE